LLPYLVATKSFKEQTLEGEFQSLFKVVEFMLVGTSGCTDIPGQERAEDRGKTRTPRSSIGTLQNSFRPSILKMQHGLLHPH